MATLNFATLAEFYDFQNRASGDLVTQLTLDTSGNPIVMTYPDAFIPEASKIIQNINNAIPPLKGDPILNAEAIADVIEYQRTPSFRDAFHRFRVSQPVTLFDSKQNHSNLPLFFDDQQVSGAGTTSTHNPSGASTILGVAAATAGRRVRQTFQRFNYQPGKSQQCVMTGTPIKTGGGAGVTVSWGLFDDNNGIFLRLVDDVPELVIRSDASGSPVERIIPQADWGGDKLDGTGASGVVFDPTKSFIFSFDYQWLGVGCVRFFMAQGHEEILIHDEPHAGLYSGVYMRTPNLPVRYEIENDGSGAATTSECICSAVISEGGADTRGITHYKSTEGVPVGLPNAGLLGAVIGIRLDANELDQSVDILDASLLEPSNVDYEYVVLMNPTLAGPAPTFAAIPNSTCQIAIADLSGANIVTGGTAITGGFVKSEKSSGAINAVVNNALSLGGSIAGVPDEIWLCARPVANGVEVDGALSWREKT